jgi:uncharacterized protein
MRQAKLQLTDKEKINKFLAEAKTGYLGLVDQEYPYVVPLNYVWKDESIYIHGAAEGRKMDVIRQNPNACFTVSEDLGTLTDPVPAMTDTAYISVMIFGKIEMVTDLDEVTAAMQEMLNKYVPGYYHSPLAKSHVEKYRSSLGSRTAVLKLHLESLSAKANELNEKTKFYPGRTVTDRRPPNVSK